MTAPAAALRDPEHLPHSGAEHDRMANAIRALAMDAVEQAQSGHPGLPMGAADIATVLFTRLLTFDPTDPTWPDRDRFVLSTGPLGQGLGNAVGMAIAERHLAAVFGGDIVDHSTYVLASDGDLMEGISQEAIALAGHLKLKKLVVLFDDNGISIDGPLALADSVDQVKRFEAAGWAASRIDGHDPDAIAREKLGWSYPAFEVPADTRDEWRKAGARSQGVHAAWKQRLKAMSADKRTE